jgi:hypothetical protein
MVSRCRICTPGGPDTAAHKSDPSPSLGPSRSSPSCDHQVQSLISENRRQVPSAQAPVQRGSEQSCTSCPCFDLPPVPTWSPPRRRSGRRKLTLPPPGPDGSARHAESVGHLAETDPARPHGDLTSRGSPPGPGHRRNLLPDQADRTPPRRRSGRPALDPVPVRGWPPQADSASGASSPNNSRVSLVASAGCKRSAR